MADATKVGDHYIVKYIASFINESEQEILAHDNIIETDLRIIGCSTTGLAGYPADGDWDTHYIFFSPAISTLI